MALVDLTFLSITYFVFLSFYRASKYKGSPLAFSPLNPGDWSMLTLILCVFIIEFCIHYIIESGSTIATYPLFKILSVPILGSIAGISLGRSICFFWKYKLATQDLR